jgi:hypothetical protein
MNDNKSRKTLQLFYAGLMVDAASNFEHFGVVEHVTAKKAREQVLAAPGQLTQLGISSPKDLFEKFSEIFGCARWELHETADGTLIAETKSCLACAIAKKRASGRPCELYCINPFHALANALSPSKTMFVDETLWDGDRCRFRLENSAE